MLAITLIAWRWLGTAGNKRGVPGAAGGGALAAGGGRGAAFSRGWAVAVGASCLAIYVALACLLSCVWLKGDDYIFLPCSTSGPAERFFFIFGRYINWVSRSGEIAASLIGLSENRWQAYLLIPAMVAALPFALHRLVAPAGQSVFSARGFLFIWFCVGLALVSVSANWRNYWCFAASQNYLMPMAAIFFFLSQYRPERAGRARGGRLGKAACAGMFLLGLYCGWALECISAFMLPGLLFWCWRRKARGLPVSAPCWAGLLGAAWGAFMLFASPALGRRAESEAAACALEAEGMGFSQMLDFCLNLTPENLRLLQGRTVRLFLGEIPLPLHAFFLPELMRQYLPCCAYAMAACALAGACLALARGKGARRELLVAGGGVLLSFACACSYLYSCVPRGMSFLPASYIMLATACYLFLRCGRPRALRPLLAAAAAGGALWHILPAGIEAWEYRPARALRMQELHARLDRGEKRITLHHHWAQPPVDSLGLISGMDLTAKAEDYPNFIAARAYGAESITLEPKTDTKH